MPIPISNFKEYVARMHQNRDQGFEREFNVCDIPCMAVCGYEDFLP